MKNWKKITISSFAETQSGGTPSTFKREYWDGDVPWINSGELKDCNIYKASKFITKEGLKNSSAKLLPPKTVVIALTGATTAKVGILEIETSANQSVTGIIPNENFNSKFLFYQLISLRREILKNAIGTAQPHINKRIVDSLEISFPKINEQNEVVSKIEELFSELDKGIENLRLGQQQLKTYRQSVLKWAFEGKLTNEKVKEGELPEGWEWRRLGDVCDKIQDGSHFSPQLQYDEPGKNRFKYITAKNIRNDYMDFRKVTYVDKDFHDSIYCRCNPEFGDVLLTKDGINTGEVTLNTLHEPFSLLSSVCIFKTKKKDLRSEFLKYFIQSPFGSKAILDSMTGTAIKRIVLRKIKDSEIVLPPIDEQHNIVQEIESRLSVADKMEESIAQSLQQAEALRQSILKKAFEGRLV